jgi:methylenetetrahydrofolate--tRNA-(uracil-5-)-methyltransferase
MASAAQAAVPAGQALAVDRHLFSSWITAKIRAHPLIEVVEEEVMSLEGMEGPIIVASGPLNIPNVCVLFTNLSRRRIPLFL